MDPRVKELLDLPENKVCAECGDDQTPRWCSVNLGVVVCSDCAGVHRKLGVHISFIQSPTLDRWKEPWIEKLSSVGNKAAAEMYEASLPQCWTRPRVQAIGGDRIDASAAVHLERFLRAKYETRLFARADARVEASAEEEEPFAEEFSVLLRRGTGKEPFGFAPRRPALRRGVLEIKAPMTPGTPAGQWNDAQESDALELQPGDCILSVNGVLVSKEDAGAAALQLLKQEQQVLLAVLRPRPSNHSHGYEQLMGVAYGLFNPGKLNSIKALLAKNVGGEKALFIRICSKYCATSEDWQELFDGIAERCSYIDGGGPRAVRMAAKAVARLKGLSAGDEPGLLEALCRHLSEEVSAESAEAEVDVQPDACKAPLEGESNDADTIDIQGGPHSEGVTETRVEGHGLSRDDTPPDPLAPEEPTASADRAVEPPKDEPEPAADAPPGADAPGDGPPEADAPEPAAEPAAEPPRYAPEDRVDARGPATPDRHATEALAEVACPHSPDAVTAELSPPGADEVGEAPEGVLSLHSPEARLREPSPELQAPRAPPQGSRGSVAGEPVNGEHLSWPQFIVTLQLVEASGTAWGIRHSKAALRQLRLLVVKGVVPDSSAAAAGLRKGDVVEMIGGEDPVEYLVATALRGREGAKGAEATKLTLTLRRQAEPTDL